MPLYGAGGLDTGIKSLLRLASDQVVLETDDHGITRLYADDGDGGAPQLTAADCALIGAALVALGQ